MELKGAGELVDRIGVRLHPTRDDTAILPVSPAVVRDGEFLVAALMLAADIASGVRLHDPNVPMVLTTSFALRRATRTAIGLVNAIPTRLFEDGRRFVDRVDFRGGAGEAVATGRISFVVRRPDEASPKTYRDVLSQFRKEWAQPIQQPLIKAAGIETVDAARGCVTMRAGSDVRRKVGMLQGAFVTLLGEASALVLAEHHYQAPAVVESLDVEYLAAATADTVTTEARWLDVAGESDIEVVLRSDAIGEDHGGLPLAVFLIGVARADSR